MASHFRSNYRVPSDLACEAVELPVHLPRLEQVCSNLYVYIATGFTRTVGRAAPRICYENVRPDPKQAMEV